MKLIILFYFFLFLVLNTVSSIYIQESSIPTAPIYPPRWTITARFHFTNSSNGAPAGSGVLYQVVDSASKLFRADDLYFIGSFPNGGVYDTLVASTIPNHEYQLYARLDNDGIHCTVYPGKPTTLSQNWVSELCKYNSTAYYEAKEAYRWNCATDVVTWYMDTDAVSGILLYQHTYPQPFFDVYQDLWFEDFKQVEKFDESIFMFPKSYKCPINSTS